MYNIKNQLNKYNTGQPKYITNNTKSLKTQDKEAIQNSHNTIKMTKTFNDINNENKKLIEILKKILKILKRLVIQTKIMICISIKMKILSFMKIMILKLK